MNKLLAMASTDGRTRVVVMFDDVITISRRKDKYSPWRHVHLSLSALSKSYRCRLVAWLRRDGWFTHTDFDGDSVIGIYWR